MGYGLIYYSLLILSLSFLIINYKPHPVLCYHGAFEAVAINSRNFVVALQLEVRLCKATHE
jgi:hypothetical protein